MKVPKLPPVVAEAWGLRAPVAKGPRPALSRTRIVEAAVDLADRQGLAAVSMSRVAAKLRVATMSLYRHVASKDDLLALMMDRVFAEPPAPPPAGEGWRGGLARWARAHLAVLRRHRWVVRVPLTGPPLLPNQVAWFDRGLACLTGTRLPEGAKVMVLLLVNGFVRNEALLTSDLEAAHEPSRHDGADYGRLLSSLVDAERFPALRKVLDATVFDGPGGLDAQFDFGLERILDGVAALRPEG